MCSSTWCCWPSTWRTSFIKNACLGDSGKTGKRSGGKDWLVKKKKKASLETLVVLYLITIPTCWISRYPDMLLGWWQCKLECRSEKCTAVIFQRAYLSNDTTTTSTSNQKKGKVVGGLSPSDVSVMGLRSFNTSEANQSPFSSCCTIPN